MAILQVSYNRKTKVATLHPIGSASPSGSELLGTTGSGVTFYHAVQSLLRSIGVLAMGPVRIVFAGELTPVVEVKEPDEEEEDEIPNPTPDVPTVVDEPTVQDEPVVEQKKKSGLF